MNVENECERTQQRESESEREVVPELCQSSWPNKAGRFHTCCQASAEFI